MSRTIGEVEADHLVVERDDLRPVGVADVADVGVDGVDRGEDLVAPRRLARVEAHADQSVALGDQLAVPGAAVLLVEGDEFTARRHARGPAGLRLEHQRQKPGDLAVGRHQVTYQSCQPDCLGGQVAADRLLVGARGQVALVEDQVEDGEHSGDSGRDVLT